MAKFQLNGGEKLLGEAQASHVKTVMFLPQANPGKLYVTDRRVVFEPTQGKASSAFESALEEIEGFTVGAASTITLRVKGGESRKITGMFNKKLIQALTEAGVQKS
ncbi:GRAM domain-containing protein [Oscillibacter sp.]|uniref:GRAM domain-containing protein n=1 Tax=Oscillibacter sp. TaxID=1945593 RepID=UPI00216BA2DC|nr:GRAM domain-containing protein [Oscillibacter sp.]MCI9648723.1 hypothetical protein [Oscillibacter sp.]